MYKRTLFTIILFFLCCSLSQAFGIRPLVIDLELRPGDTAPFELTLAPEHGPEVVNLSLYQPVQGLEGGLDYLPGDPQVYPAIAWVKLTTERVNLIPGDSVRVKGEVKVPYNAGGTYPVVVMAEPVVEQPERGVALQVRYAVRLNINVVRPGIKPAADVLAFQLEPDPEGQPLLIAHLKNPSPLLYRATAEVTIRDQGRHLIEKVNLSTNVRNRQDSFAVYPGAEILLRGKPVEPLLPGIYDLRLFLRYAEGKQIIKGATVEVKPGMFRAPVRTEYLRVAPTLIEAGVRAGGADTQVLMLENRTNEELTIKLSGRDIEPEYAQSLFETLQVQLRGTKPEFTLAPRRTIKPLLLFQNPRDVQPGGYYGYLDLAVYAAGQLQQQATIPIRILVGTDWPYSVEVLGLSCDQNAQEALFSVEVRNLSKVHLNPAGTLILKTPDEAVLKTMNLTLQEGSPPILPQRSDLLLATGTAVPPGEYIAEISLALAGKEITKTVLPLTIEK